MPYYRKKKTTTKRKYAKKAPAKSFAAKVKAVVNKQAEVKYFDTQAPATQKFTGMQLVAYDASIVAQGVGQGQRVGMQIHAKSIRVSVVIAGIDTIDHNVMLLFLKSPAGLPLTTTTIWQPRMYQGGGDFLVDPRQENTGVTVLKQKLIRFKAGQLNSGGTYSKQFCVWNIPMKDVKLDYTNDANGRTSGDFQYWFAFISDQSSQSTGADQLALTSVTRIYYTDA